MRRLAIAALVVALTACSSEQQNEATGGNQNASTTTTLDPSTLQVTQDIKPLPPTEFNIAPAIVSTQGSESSGTSSAQVSASDIARQEQLLRDLDAKRNVNGIVVSLPEVVLFDFGKSDLRVESSASLDKVNELLKFYPLLSVSIEGHTDNVGSDGSNQALSIGRAESVKTGLVARGADSSRLGTNGFGESRPALANDSEDNRQKNRRVEIVFKGA